MLPTDDRRRRRAFSKSRATHRRRTRLRIPKPDTRVGTPALACEARSSSRRAGS
jgi:hypothetical protein